MKMDYCFCMFCYLSSLTLVTSVTSVTDIGNIHGSVMTRYIRHDTPQHLWATHYRILYSAAAVAYCSIL